jgi:Zn-dependent protease with chaperone function
VGGSRYRDQPMTNRLKGVNQMDETEIQAEVDRLTLAAGIRDLWKVTVYQGDAIDGECQPWPLCKIRISGTAASLRPDLVRAALAHEVGHARQPRTAILSTFVCAGLAALFGIPFYPPFAIVMVVALAIFVTYAWWEIDAERWAAGAVGKQTVLELRGELPGLTGRAQRAISAWIIAR